MTAQLDPYPALPAWILQIDRNRQIRWINRADSVSEAQALASRLEDLVHPQDRDAVVQAVARTFASGVVTSYRVRGGIGESLERHYEGRVARLEDREDLAVVVVTDVTDDALATERLRESEERYRTLATHVPDMISTVSRDLHILSFNRLADGVTDEQALGAHLSTFMPPEHLEVAAAAIERALTDGGLQQFEARALIDGILRLYRTRVVSLAPGPDGIERALLITTDVTDREQVHEELRLSEQRLARTLEASALTLWEWDGQGSAPWLGDVHADDRARVRMAIEDHVRGASAHLEVEYRTAAVEHWRWVDTRGQIVQRGPDDQVLRVLGTHQDITARRAADTEREALRDQLVQAQKMEVIGQLAGGIAHDFNNLLLVIQSHASFAREELEGLTSVADDDIDAVLTATERAAELTQQLLAVARRQPIDPRPLDVHDLISQVTRLLQRTLPATIQIRQYCPDPAPVVMGDAGQLQQVLMNLSLNARDAMPNGGTLSFEVEPDVTDGLILLTVRDDGEGMQDEVANRVFEPFFSTKEAGRGSGLGLAMAHGIVRQHGGTIDVISVPGGGTSFHILLPAGVSATPEAPRIFPAATRQAVVLVAEDQPMVRAAVARVLRGAGHEVLEAADGLQAVRIFDEHHDRIELALLVVVMPGLTGREVFDHIQRRCPGTPVLFTSGYSAEVLEASFLERTGSRVLVKPYQFPVLLRRIQQELGRRA